MVNPPRSITASAAMAKAGVAARIRSGVGPAANNSRSTELVASSPKVVITPAATFRPIMATASRRLTDQASRIASPTIAGSRRTTTQKLVAAKAVA
jgi:hypothetical protein